MPGRARFAVGRYEDYLDLPIRVRNAMLDQIETWRAQEEPKK